MKGKMKNALKVHLIQPIKCTIIKTRFSFIIKLVFNAKMGKKLLDVSARSQNTFGGVMIYTAVTMGYIV